MPPRPLLLEVALAKESTGGKRKRVGILSQQGWLRPAKRARMPLGTRLEQRFGVVGNNGVFGENIGATRQHALGEVSSVHGGAM